MTPMFTKHCCQNWISNWKKERKIKSSCSHIFEGKIFPGIAIPKAKQLHAENTMNSLQKWEIT
jgi:hypothetical protein